jgi:hypothetical protein
MTIAQTLHNATRTVARADIPSVALLDGTNSIKTLKYLDAWSIPARNGWNKRTGLSIIDDKVIIHYNSFDTKPANAAPCVFSPDSEDTFLGKQSWRGNYLAVFAFACASKRADTAIVELETDCQVALFNNGTLIKEVSNNDIVELGENIFIPVELAAGDNVFVVKMLSHDGPPRLRASVILDDARDLSVAWNARPGLLEKSIHSISNDQDTPRLGWNPALARLQVSTEVCDVLTGRTVLTREALRNGNLVRDRANPLREGLYKITYKTKTETASEYFVIGSPKRLFEKLRTQILSVELDKNDKINIAAQIKRGEILLSRENYDPVNQAWQRKVCHTLVNLATFANMLESGQNNLTQDIPGLHIRGFVSGIDQSMQYYRLFIPSSYAPEKRIPLLLIPATKITARKRPFIESPFLASHDNAIKICQYAEKHGFAILWPGYRNAPDGWTYEFVHIIEALSAVERDYQIDDTRISLYGMCSSGYFAGNLVSKYPERFAGIIYDRAIFDRSTRGVQNNSESIKTLLGVLNPSERVISNRNVRILVLNDGSKPVGHGEMELSEKFVKTAAPKRSDLQAILGRRPDGKPLWDLIFEWLHTCRNETPGKSETDVFAEHGYSGPISEVFAKPFIVVEGTAADKKGRSRIKQTIGDLRTQYTSHFHEADFITKADTEITEDIVKSHSLVLVGNPSSNMVWKQLQDRIPLEVLPEGVSVANRQFTTGLAFAGIFRNPENTRNYILLIGSQDLEKLSLPNKLELPKVRFDFTILQASKTGNRNVIIHTLGRKSERP